MLHDSVKDLKDIYKYRETDLKNIPTDRYFRNAWTDDLPTETVDIDMKKACNIHMNNLRTIRATKFPQLDLDYLRADEADNADKKKEIAALKQQLRDVPQTYDLSVAKTPDELKAMIPDCLK